MSSLCVGLANELGELLFCAANLPLDVVDNTVLDLESTSSDVFLINDGIFAPAPLSATAVKSAAVNMRVPPGRTALFKLSPTKSEPQHKPHAHVLTALASVTQITASIRFANRGAGAFEMQVPVDFAASAEFDCVFLAVAVPPDAAEGSLVVMRRLHVAGYTVDFLNPQMQVKVGFNHDPSPSGKVLQAAFRGDLPAITAALLSDGSTEEVDIVSHVEMQHFRWRLQFRLTVSMCVFILQATNTCLMVAIMKGHYNAARDLIESGANVRAVGHVRSL